MAAVQTTPAIRATLKLHKWASGFTPGTTAAQHMVNIWRAQRGTKRATVRSSLTHIFASRRPPVRALRAAILERAVSQPAGVTTAELWACAAYFRKWGVPIDEHLAWLLLEACERDFAHSTLQETPPTDTTTSLPGIDVMEGHACPVLFARRLRLLWTWLQTDRVHPGRHFLEASLKASNTLSNLSVLFSERSEPGRPRHARTYLASISVISGNIAADTARNTLSAMRALGVSPTQHHAETVFTILLRSRRFPEAEALFCSSLSDDAHRERLISSAAGTNLRGFSQLFSRWGSASLAPHVVVWYAHGAGAPCTECGEGNNHHGAPPLEGEERVVQCKLRRPVLANRVQSQWERLIGEQAGGAGHSAAALRLMQWVREENVEHVWQRQHLEALMQISLQAQPTEYKAVVNAVKEVGMFFLVEKKKEPGSAARVYTMCFGYPRNRRVQSTEQKSLFHPHTLASLFLPSYTTYGANQCALSNAMRAHLKVNPACTLPATL